MAPGLGFYIGLAVFGAAVFLILKLMRRSADHAQLEEREAWQRAQVEGEKRKAASDRDTVTRMADRDADSVSDTVAAARERMRTRDPGTR